MSLVFAGVCSHAPGITGRAARAEPSVRDTFYAKLGEMRARLEAAKPDALIVVAAEHFANFFMNNMPAYCVGMADCVRRPDRGRGVARDQAPARARQRGICRGASSRRCSHDIDVAYAEEWKFDHGIMVPLHFLTPRYDLPVIPVNINCQGPPLTPLHARVRVRPRAAPRVRRAARAHRARRHGRHLALARDAGLGHDQRSMGSRVPRALPRERSRGAHFVQRRGDAARRGAGRVRDPHVPRRRRRDRGRDRRAAVLRPDPDLRRRLHRRDDGGRVTHRHSTTCVRRSEVQLVHSVSWVRSALGPLSNDLYVPSLPLVADGPRGGWQARCNSR